MPGAHAWRSCRQLEPSELHSRSSVLTPRLDPNATRRVPHAVSCTAFVKPSRSETQLVPTSCATRPPGRPTSPHTSSPLRNPSEALALLEAFVPTCDHALPSHLATPCSGEPPEAESDPAAN